MASKTPVKIPEQLSRYRAQIDALDVELIDVLARRFEVVRAVARLKALENLNVVQPERAAEVKRRAAEMGTAKGLDGAFITRLYEMMIDHAHEMEHAIVADGTAEKGDKNV